MSDEWRAELRELYPALRRFAAVVADSDMAPDDVVHDAVVSALRRNRSRNVADVAAYMRRAIVNTVANERRRLGRARRAMGRIQRRSVDGANDAYPSDLDHLKSLSPRARAVLYLHYVEGCSFDEIAADLGIRTGAARQAAVRARRELNELEGIASC